MDITGFPAPENAPEPGACVRTEEPEPGLVIVILDPPHRSFPVLDAPLLRDLAAVVSQLERESLVRGVIFTGREPEQFLAGADIEAIAQIEDTEVVERLVTEVHELFMRISKLAPRTVAAVGGPVPGGAYELCLACDRIVASDHPKTRIGLPETQLGIIPGWGGTHRLPKRVGLPAALDAILSGRLYPARQAKKLGMVDRVTKPEYLLRVATDVALGRERCPRFKRGWKAWAVDRNPLARFVIENAATKQVEAKAHGNYPAPYAALDLVMAAARTPMAFAARKEARAVGALATGSVCKNLIEIFFASEAAKKLGKGTDEWSPRHFEHAAVVGAGVMGAGIASLMAEKGVAVRLADLQRDALERALDDHRSAARKKLRRRRIQRHEYDAIIDRLDTTEGLVGMGRAQIVVEAVAEVLEVKRKVLAELAEQLPEDAILATNTSSLSVDAIAEGLPRPQRVVGMHFFNPVRRMPLVEIVQGPRTNRRAVTEVAALALRLGKTPVVVKDVPGFLVNRVLGPYLDEAVRLFIDGVDPARVDRLLVDFGMPMGPFALLDEVGFDIAAHAAESLHAGYGERMTPSDGLENIMGSDRLGKKTGAGFYLHPASGGRRARKRRRGPEVNHDVLRFQRTDAEAQPRNEQILDRLLLSMVNEAARCLAEEVVAGPRTLDLATVFGIGFAPFRGGLLRWADTRGAREIVEALEAILEDDEMQERPGAVAKFTPAPLLVRLMEERRAFHGPRPEEDEVPAPSVSVMDSKGSAVL